MFCKRFISGLLLAASSFYVLQPAAGSKENLKNKLHYDNADKNNIVTIRMPFLVWMVIQGNTSGLKSSVSNKKHLEKTTAAPPCASYTPLLMAAQIGQAKCLKILIEAGANVNAKLQDKKTALHLAIEKEHLDCVKLLLDCPRTNINCLDNNGMDPLHYAAYKGLTPVVRALLGRGVTIDRKNISGMTPLMLAAQRGHQETVQALIHAGAAVDLQRNDGFTPLHIAAMGGKRNCVIQLLRAGADDTIRTAQNIISDISEKTAAELATRYNHPEIARIISTIQERRAPAFNYDMTL